MQRRVSEILRIFQEKGWTLALAESCTGGLISAELVRVSGVSAIYQGGVIAYANEAKVALLGVSEDLIRSYGAVSEEVAKAMAQGAKERLGADWALSTTGIAGPSGGTREKPVGTVCFGLVGPAFVQVQTQQFTGERNDVQQRAAELAFEWIYSKCQAL